MPLPVEVPRAPETAKPATETSNPTADAAKKAAKDNGARWKKMNPLRLLKALATKKEPAPATQTEAPQAQTQPQPDRNPSVVAVQQGELAQAQARGAANPDQEALMGMTSSGIDMADLGSDGQVRSPQTETVVSPQPDVASESAGAEQSSAEVTVASPVSSEPIDITAARAQRRPDTTPATQTGPVSADTTQPTPNPETQTPPDAETVARQQEALDKISGVPDGLGYVIAADTNPSVLLAQLVKSNGWQPDRATADYVRGAIDLAKSKLDPEARAALRQPESASPDVQLEAFNKIDPLYKVAADTDPAVLMANLVQNQGWEVNPETAAYVQAAVDHVTPPVEGSSASTTGTAGSETLAEATTPISTAPEEPAETASVPKTEVQLLREALAARDNKIDKLEVSLAETNEAVKKLTEYMLEKENDQKKKKTLLDILKALGKGASMGAIGLASDFAEAAQAEATGQQAA